MKKVSVIIPTYRGEKYLYRSLKTVLSQNYKNIEIIVVDDNGINTISQKKTQEIVSGFHDDRIIYITHKKNSNGAASRNTGIRAAKGDFVCFHDDDDLMLPNRIVKCVKALDNKKQYDGVFMDVAICNSKLTPNYIVKVRKAGNCWKDILLNAMFIGSGSNIFLTKKSVDETGLFDEKFIRHQDLEYMIRFYEKFTTTYIGEIGIIKSENDICNVPSYPKYKENEEYYITKFENEINALSKNERKIFYSKMQYFLLKTELLYYKLTFSNIKRALRLSPKDFLIVIMTKMRIANTFIVKRANEIIKSFRSLSVPLPVDAKLFIKGIKNDKD